jgi:hypothetical protein
MKPGPPRDKPINTEWKQIGDGCGILVQELVYFKNKDYNEPL